MTAMSRGIFVTAALVLLSGCFHIQLNGSVGGATVRVVAVDDPETILFEQTSLTEDDWIGIRGEDKWEQAQALLKLAFIGIIPQGVNNLDPEAMFLVTASGGEDYDADGNRSQDTNATTVTGEWRALVSGARLQAGNVKVSAMTEAAYQQVKDVLGIENVAAITALLDALAVELVTDVDANQWVDYEDLIAWNRTFDAGSFAGEIERLNAIGSAVAADASSDELASLAAAVVTSARIGKSGTWAISDLVNATQCGEGVYSDNYSLGVTQSGSTINVSAPAGNFVGTINGDSLRWSGSYPEDGGTTTTSINVSFSGDSLSGSSSWSWTDGDFSCAGTSSVSGNRQG